MSATCVSSSVNLMLQADSCLANLLANEDGGCFDSPCCELWKCLVSTSSLHFLPKTNFYRLLQNVYFPRLREDETSHVTELALGLLSNLNGEVSFFASHQTPALETDTAPADIRH